LLETAWPASERIASCVARVRDAWDGCPPGRSCHQDVSDAFGRLREATALLRPELAKATISVTPTSALRWQIPNLADFANRHPDIDFRILSTERVLSFQSDGIDLAVRQGCQPFGAQSGIELLLRQSIVAATRVVTERQARTSMARKRFTQQVTTQMTMEWRTRGK